MFKINKIFLLVPITLILFVALFTNTLTSNIVHAQPSTDTYIPLAPLPGAAPAGGTGFNTYVRGMFALLIGIAAVLAVLMIVIGGIQYMSTDAISGKSEGKEKITQALYGLFLAMACWLILYTIDPKILNFDVLNKNSFPVSYNAGTTYGATPPGVPGWYVQYDYQCVTPTSVWLRAYYGPFGDDYQACEDYITNWQTGACANGSPEEYRNIQCVAF
jgi:hypothetical protein